MYPFPPGTPGPRTPERMAPMIAFKADWARLVTEQNQDQRKVFLKLWQKHLPHLSRSKALTMVKRHIKGVLVDFRPPPGPRSGAVRRRG